MWLIFKRHLMVKQRELNILQRVEEYWTSHTLILLKQKGHCYKHIILWSIVQR